MSQPPLFSSGQELASLVVNSSLLNLSHKSILAAYAETKSDQSQKTPTIKHRVHKESNCTVITFVTTQDHFKQELVSSVEDIFPPFKFLQTSIAINRAAITLFASYHHELLQLKAQYENSSQLIITGHSEGGSIASLFTLWLLENTTDHKYKPPICVTFGAPLLGDKLLQKLISEQPKWNSAFLHVAATLDQVPRLFVNNPSSKTVFYEPFGMYLLCSESGRCSFLELPKATAEVLVAMNQNLQCSEEFSIASYGKVITSLESGVICRGITKFGEVVRNSLRAGITLQLEGIGFTMSKKMNDVDDLIAKIEELEMADFSHKRQTVDPGKKLNTIKLKMAQLEWYKKKANNMQMSYYDHYKTYRTRADQDVVMHHRFLTTYWKQTIKESENNPCSGVTFSRIRWLYGGTNYTRMVEPFNIADFYKVKGRKSYITSGRSQHYVKLEEYLVNFGKANDNSIDSRKENVDAILTEDSCFWARVEEALISCECLRKTNCSNAEKDLIEFEKYVLGLMKNYVVSPEIFLEKSSFMKWWRQYEEIKGSSYSSRLTGIMKTSRYLLYAKGKLEV